MVISHALRIFNDIQGSVGAIWIQNLRTQKWASTSGWSFDVGNFTLPVASTLSAMVMTVTKIPQRFYSSTMFYRHLMILMFRKIWSWHELTGVDSTLSWAEAAPKHRHLQRCSRRRRGGGWCLAQRAPTPAGRCAAVLAAVAGDAGHGLERA